MNPIVELGRHGQSIWYDYIQRSLIWTGALHRMVVEDGLAGVTSNPAIFEKAIGGSKDYAAAVKGVVGTGAADPGEVFERIAIHDIQLAADVLRPVYDRTQGRDGYVSYEVSPHLALDTEATLSEARRLWTRIGRDNVMIKVPATAEGIPAIEQLLSEGININITLLFAVEAYEKVHLAYLSGLERLAKNGGDVSKVASVASFFVSRIDTLVDKRIDERLAQNPDAAAKKKLESLKGKVAVANAKIAYASYQKTIAGDRWKQLAAKGARTQRLLWASTGTKNKAYSDVLYVEELIGPDTVNTVPEATYNAFKDHGKVAETLTKDLAGAESVMKTLGEVDIQMRSVTDELLVDGVVLFADAFDKLLATVAARRREIVGDRLNRDAFHLPKDLQAEQTKRLESMRKSAFVRRLWAKDSTLFGGSKTVDPAVSGFMGWLGAIDDMMIHAERLRDLRDEVKKEGFAHVVLMGMGGSSLAPDVFQRTFGRIPGFPELKVLDSTVPAQVASLEASIDPKKTLFIVSSKSGTTTEPLVFDRTFFDKVKDGASFIAVTDPGSKLEHLARERRFRHVFPGDPEIGGRYSALSSFGLVPAAAMGLDTDDLLLRAQRMAKSVSRHVPPADNDGVRLGTLLGIAAEKGKDKLTIVTTPGLRSFGSWLEQLIAESTGKHGKGIIPVDGEALADPSLYGADRVFAYLRLEDDAAKGAAGDLDRKIEALRAKDHPVVTIAIKDAADLVEEMFRWEIATATAGHVLGINPFDQPNVQESKDFTSTFLAAFKKDGKLPDVPGEKKVLEADGIKVYADEQNAAALKGRTGSIKDLLAAHLERAKAGDYVAFNAYLEMNDANDQLLQALRHRVRDEKKVATTLGYGPRFLHSTGQLHKGGPDSGVFVQITSDDAKDVPIPGEPYTYGVLKTAQANGDFQALSKRGRRLIRIHLPKDVLSGLKKL